MEEESTRWTLAVHGDNREWTTAESFTEEEALKGFRSEEDSDWLKVFAGIHGPVGFVRVRDIRRFEVDRSNLRNPEVIGFRVRFAFVEDGEEIEFWG